MIFLYLFAGILLGGAAVGVIAYIQIKHAESILKIKEDEFKKREEASTLFRRQEVEQMRDSFKQLSQEIFEKKNAAGNESLEKILKPFDEKLKEFKSAVEAAKLKNVELNSKLSTELKTLAEQSKQLGADAQNLTNALRGTNKVQGDWGEIILDELLERSGLKRGIHYEIQSTMRDQYGNLIKSEENSILRPDVIVHYPGKQDIIIDSKVSLTKYIDFVNSEDPEARATALQEHVASVRRHIAELSKKDYSGYLAEAGKESIGYTVMFIPNEGSCQAALSSAPDLWKEAFDKKVLLASPMTLLALLEVIHLAWLRTEQDARQQEILKTADMLVDRLYAFYEEFDKIEVKLNDAHAAFDQAAHRLKDGPRSQSVVKAGLQLRKLGVKFNKEKRLPKSLAVDDENENILELPDSK